MNNEYTGYTVPTGDYTPLTYDQNGNLVSDGYRIFVYDYLDRLCEIHQDGGAPLESGSGKTGKKKKLTKLSLTQVRNFLTKEHSKDLSKKSLSTGIGSAASKKPSKSQSASSSTAGYTIWGLYGYDPGNRRIYRTTADQVSGSWTSATTLNPSTTPYGFTGRRRDADVMLLAWASSS